MKRYLTAVALVALAGCGGGSKDNSAMEARIVAALSPGWPGATEAELHEKAQVFVKGCTETFDDTAQAAMRMVLDMDTPDHRGFQIFYAGCPDRVKQIMG